jgi:predicted Zn finger-like uncharacterized protein
MSLATRCPACSTTFRVVQDQLKVSEGWVRCGRCDEAFNALEGLFDLERDSGLMGLDELGPDVDPGMAPTERLPLDELPSHRPKMPVPAPAVVPVLAPAASTEGQGYDVYFSRDDTDLATTAAAAEGMPSTTAEEQAPATDQASAPQPEFLRRAQRAAMWRQPAVRAALSAACVLAAAALALQWVVHQRDVLATHRPDWAPALRQMCAVLGCKVETLRDLAAVVVDSSGLEATDAASQFHFQAVLRNQSAVPIATPSLDLSLTDASGKVVSRKTLMPADFGAATPQTLAAGAEAPLNAVLDVGPLRVTGYTVLAYYP